ncbi:hypothetical protein FRC05_001951 [Tulasnella sp. 425]|nr:hypothetical protein FRC05_001951 [Tulasnella sp. 425]
METEDAVYDILEDIPPPLEHTAELLKSIIQTASSSPRNTQKILHLVSRGVEILQALRTPFSEPGPSDFYEMIVAMESVRKLELILMEARSLIEQEATLPTSYTEESKATWGVRRDKLHDLLVEAHAPEFNPPNDWEKALEDVARVDDHLWVGMIAHDIWNGGSNLELAKEVERTAAKLLELKDNSRKQDIERIMMGWEPSRTDAHSPPRSLRDFPMPLRSLGSGSRNSRSNSPVPSRQDSPAPGAISLESSHMNKIFQSLSDYYIPKHRLRIREQTLGGGGFGRVKLADLSTETGFPAGNTLTTVAVKILHTENFDGVPLGIAVRLAREIELWASCKHANILELTGYYNSEDFREVYMISPYMANGNIKDYLSREAPSQEHRLKLVLGTIKGLAYLHTREPPIVHGDLKSVCPPPTTRPQPNLLATFGALHGL